MTLARPKLAADRRLWYPFVREVLVMRHVSLAAAGTCAFVVVAALAAHAVRAEAPPEGALTLEVEVGQTVARDVGFALGLRCDDLTIAEVELRASTPQSNVFVVTGARPGTTLCRVGTTTDRPTYLYQIRVVPAHHRN